jgi:hypothetical protein
MDMGSSKSEKGYHARYSVTRAGQSTALSEVKITKLV